MGNILCSVCGKVIDEEEIYACISCGGIVCKDHYDWESGFCINCLESKPFEGC